MNVARTLMTKTIARSTRPLAAAQTRSFSTRKNGSNELYCRQWMLDKICTELILTEDELGEIDNLKNTKIRLFTLNRKNSLISLYHLYCEEIKFLQDNHPSDFTE